jgi:endonuclease YncB( thermonuclease family)
MRLADVGMSKKPLSKELPRPYVYNATLFDSYDGDTATFDIDLGFRITNRVRVRLAGVNCPEIGSRAASVVENDKGHAAHARLDELIKGKKVILITEKDIQDQYGRYLAWVYIDTEDISVNEILVNEGHAEVYPKKR